MRTFTKYTLEDIQSYKWWSSIIIDSFNKIQKHISNTWLYLDIYYIKDKRWHIDISYSWWDEYVIDILLDIEVKTCNICCECWDKWVLRKNIGWRMPYCNKCFILFFDDMGKRKKELNNPLNKLDSELKIIDEKVKELLHEENNVSESTTNCKHIIWIVIAIIVLLYFIF